MRLTEQQKRRIRITAVTFVIACLASVTRTVEIPSGASTEGMFTGEDGIVCAIDLGSPSQGSSAAGYNYELLQEFAKDNRCGIRIIPAPKDSDCLDSLYNGKIGIVVRKYADSLEARNDITVSKVVGDEIVWVTGANDSYGIRRVNSWLSHFMESGRSNVTRAKYFRTYNPHKMVEQGLTVKTISPYDGIIKQYSDMLGWDWRMLAAVIYQESKFNISTRSRRGAFGLMQVMPRTAQYYHIDNLLDPQQNVEAGTLHLKRLQDQLRKQGVEGEELVKFTLAAYNAGEGRIADCRSLTASRGADCNLWSDVAGMIPLMREDSILQEESVKLGKFKGYETVAYVDNVMSLYRDYCTVCPEK